MKGTDKNVLSFTVRRSTIKIGRTNVLSFAVRRRTVNDERNR